VVRSPASGSSPKAVIEDSMPYLQTAPEKWYTNIDNVTAKLVDVISDAA
jgi:hypothetical protein